MKITFCRAKTEENLRLDGLLFEPDEGSSIGILHIHGMGGNFYENIFLDSMATEYTNAGYAFLTVNTSGHDSTTSLAIVSEEGGYKRAGQVFERFEDCILDINAWLKFFKSKGYSKFILQGHSLGTSKVVYYLSQNLNPDIKAVILASPTDMLGLVRVGKERKNFERDFKEAKELVVRGEGEKILSNMVWGDYYISADTYLNIFSEGSSADIFPTLRGGGFKELESIEVPVLAFFGGTDNAVIFSPEEDLKVISKHLKNDKSKTTVIGTAPHSYFKHEKQVALEVVEWLRRVL